MNELEKLAIQLDQKLRALEWEENRFQELKLDYRADSKVASIFLRLHQVRDELAELTPDDYESCNIRWRDIE